MNLQVSAHYDRQRLSHDQVLKPHINMSLAVLRFLRSSECSLLFTLRSFPKIPSHSLCYEIKLTTACKVSSLSSSFLVPPLKEGFFPLVVDFPPLPKVAVFPPFPDLCDIVLDYAPQLLYPHLYCSKDLLLVAKQCFGVVGLFLL